MITDLSQLFKEAIFAKGTWNAIRVRNLLSELSKSIPTATIDWEECDENWARLLEGEDVAVLVNACVPIVFVLSKLQSAVNFSDWNGVRFVSTDSFTSEVFRCEKSIVEKIAGRELSNNVDFDRLSLQDLWWATV